jgi:hypothetical protein
MAGGRQPGPQCADNDPIEIDDGTLCLAQTPPPGSLGASAVYGERKWWGAHVQSYARLKASLKGEGLHQHHLIPKSLFLNGPTQTRRLIDYVPSVTLDESEHLSTVHRALNSYLMSKGVWQRSLNSTELGAAIRFTRDFYQQHGLMHFAEAIEEFVAKIYSKAAR